MKLQRTRILNVKLLGVSVLVAAAIAVPVGLLLSSTGEASPAAAAEPGNEVALAESPPSAKPSRLELEPEQQAAPEQRPEAYEAPHRKLAEQSTTRLIEVLRSSPKEIERFQAANLLWTRGAEGRSALEAQAKTDPQLQRKLAALRNARQ